ncbi:MAG: ATP-dependent Clp protease adaptor ClpS [Planctomycetota bacterium]|nr:ATP-dependent Clp protease adaptor ClpS [Planctomycetota bacterium]
MIESPSPSPAKVPAKSPARSTPKRRPAKPAPKRRPKPQERTCDKPEQPRAWNVVLLDDDDHSYEYVIAMMQEIFRHTLERAFLVARAVDSEGRAVCLTTHREHAELKCEQIHAFGRDPLIAGCKGSMSAILEPADFGDDGDETGDGRE